MAITITEEMLRKADDYLSLAQKEGMAKAFAIACVEEMKTPGGDMLPPLLRERFGVKQQFLMGVLAKSYLHQNFKKQNFVWKGEETISGVLDACMNEEAYDEWAQSHVFSQINRFIRRHDNDLSDKAYEIMNDFKTFSMMLNDSIHALIEQNNDPLGRVMRALAADITPEATKAVLAQLDEVKGMAEQLQKEKENA